ncbi:MAG: MBL fold metallo-hydrolase [Deltaproteobacteria bacterium]|nr:MBL fold metallo-hydrolase [Deltaproteobacteria bacterium]
MKYGTRAAFFLVDPYHSRPGKWDLLVGTPLPRNDVVDAYLDGLPAKPSAVIAGHTHVDHVLDFPHLAKRLDCPIIGSRSLDTLFQIYGLPNRVRVTEGRERIELADGASVTPIPTIHGLVLFGRVPYPGEIEPGGAPPLKTKRFRHGQVFMLLLEIGGVRFLHTGSANLVDEELENVGCDVLFMCIPGWNKIDDYHGRLLGRVRPKVVIPFHFDDFTKPWRADRSAPELPFLAKDGFLAAVKEKAPDAKVIYPKTWEWMEF